MTTTHRILSTFDIKASAQTLPTGSRPDELMIDWTALPAPSTASIYLPSVSADNILSTADSLYGSHLYRKVDAHTVACDARGITYMPIPQAGGNLAGFIEVDLPGTLTIGNKFGVVVRQITTASATITTGVSRNPVFGISSQAVVRGPRPPIAWRKVIGNFQLALKIVSKTQSRHVAERNLAILRWIFEAIPRTDRWYPVFNRYLGALAGLLTILGGNPATVLPSASGAPPRTGAKVWPGQRLHPHKDSDGGLQVTGKIEGLVYDHFGDFEGFVLETEDDDRIHFFSREEHVERVVARAWSERLRVTVVPEGGGEHRLRRITLLPTPRRS
jgi:hypothetical protein